MKKKENLRFRGLSSTYDSMRYLCIFNIIIDESLMAEIALPHPNVFSGLPLQSAFELPNRPIPEFIAPETEKYFSKTV
jgi:hypothetical protein